jgi:hypothetical protein
MKHIIKIIAFLILVAAALWLINTSEEKTLILEPELRELNCVRQNYSFRARPETLIVCEEAGAILYWDSSVQLDSTRQLMISKLLEQLDE